MKIRPKFFQTLEIEETQISQDQTTKFLLKTLHNNQSIETVILKFNRSYTICLSSQVGCNVRCQFCFTGSMKNFRNLTYQEILGQYATAFEYIIEKTPAPHPPPNIVFMGQGEPLQNFQELEIAIKHLLDQKGQFRLGPRQITVSTSGELLGLKKFEKLGGVNLAFSLHTPFEDERNELIPLNKVYPLTDLWPVLKNISLKKRQFINIEYLLLGGFNTTFRHAERLSELTGQIRGIVNLIPFNPYPGAKFQRPSQEEIDQFKQWLVDMRVRTLIRTSKGDDILAACGQLANSKNSTLSSQSNYQI